MRTRRFAQVDVFTSVPLKGNPLAVVVDGEGLSDDEMQAFARWTNLSETTFLLPPTRPEADYRVRIFTTARELPFAGHPTLGSCHAWLAAGGQPKGADVVQECGVGLVTVRRSDDGRLAFAAPPLLRTGQLDDATLSHICTALGIARDEVLAHQWVDNGPGWCAVMLGSRERLLALKPDFRALAPLELGVIAPLEKVGVIAPQAVDADFEVRALLSLEAVPEDPVTGSLNAGLAQWLIGAGLAPERYVVCQGTVLGRSGRVFVEKQGDTVWIGGQVTPLVEGQVQL
jgi:PhzF family phenazine biosynthesis protein